MKKCRKCNEEKELTEFYVHSAMADGHLNICKSCVKNRVTNHRNENIEKIRENDKKRAMLPHRVSARKAYIKTDNGKIAKKKSILMYRKRYPLKYAATIITRNAIRDKILIRPLHCSECGSTKKIEGHHDDYTKPLQVRWLCEPCHKLWHKTNKAIYE